MAGKGKNLEISLLLDFYSPILTDKQREVLEYYYYEDMSLSEIAEHSLITRQGVRDNIKRGEKVLFDMEDALGFVARTAQMQKNLDAIIKAAGEIQEMNKNTLFSFELTEKISEVLTAADEIGNL